MRLLRFMLLPVLCLTQASCDTPAGRAVTADEDKAKPHLNRGAPRNGHPWVVYPDVLAKWAREIPEIAKGNPWRRSHKTTGRTGSGLYLCSGDLLTFVFSRSRL
jgi:hypothetical protein